MVFSISKTQTTLWDQFHYTGNPSEFAWVLPVYAAGVTRGALARRVHRGARRCDAAGHRRRRSAEAAAGLAAPARRFFGVLARRANDNVVVINQQIVGPYEVATLKADGSEGARRRGSLARLRRFRRGCSRPSTPTSTRASTSSPCASCRTKASRRCSRCASSRRAQTSRCRCAWSPPAVGAKVGIVLYVIGEGPLRGRQLPQRDGRSVEPHWNKTQNRSNYTELVRRRWPAATGATGSPSSPALCVQAARQPLLRRLRPAPPGCRRSQSAYTQAIPALPRESASTTRGPARTAAGAPTRPATGAPTTGTDGRRRPPTRRRRRGPAAGAEQRLHLRRHRRRHRGHEPGTTCGLRASAPTSRRPC